MARFWSENARTQFITTDDFDTIAELGKTIWSQHYVSIISQAQIDYMLADRYSSEKLSDYLNSDNRWMVLLKLDNQGIGYCSYAITDNPHEMKLEQLYLLSEYRHRGLGRMMLEFVENQARAQNSMRLTLQVNKLNTSAIGFYRKAGFLILKEAVFDIGGGFVMDDYIMEKTL